MRLVGNKNEIRYDLDLGVISKIIKITGETLIDLSNPFFYN